MYHFCGLVFVLIRVKCLCLTGNQGNQMLSYYMKLLCPFPQLHHAGFFKLVLLSFISGSSGNFA